MSTLRLAFLFYKLYIILDLINKKAVSVMKQLFSNYFFKNVIPSACAFGNIVISANCT